jgi:hypothetical protein
MSDLTLNQIKLVVKKKKHLQGASFVLNRITVFLVVDLGPLPITF